MGAADGLVLGSVLSNGADGLALDSALRAQWTDWYLALGSALSDGAEDALVLGSAMREGTVDRQSTWLGAERWTG